ncbi:hypothetical protein EDC94DRAFT_19451 [Helicostylum pulchrum]|nr:hypothetical protein EDC94DRAFT_19451 [Helicostylum pulchrum]
MYLFLSTLSLSLFYIVSVNRAQHYIFRQQYTINTRDFFKKKILRLASLLSGLLFLYKGTFLYKDQKATIYSFALKFLLGMQREKDNELTCSVN